MKWRISVLLIITGLLAVLSFSEIKEFGNDLKYPAESAVNITSYSQERDKTSVITELEKFAKEQDLVLFKPIYTNNHQSTFVFGHAPRWLSNSDGNYTQDKQLLSDTELTGMYYSSKPLNKTMQSKLTGKGFKYKAGDIGWWLAPLDFLFGNLRSYSVWTVFFIFALLLFAIKMFYLKKAMIQRSLGLLRKQMIKEMSSDILVLILSTLSIILIFCSYLGNITSVFVKTFILLNVVNMLLLIVISLISNSLFFLNVALFKPIQILKNKENKTFVQVVWLIGILLALFIFGLTINESLKVNRTLCNQIKTLDHWQAVADFVKIDWFEKNTEQKNVKGEVKWEDIIEESEENKQFVQFFSSDEWLYSKSSDLGTAEEMNIPELTNQLKETGIDTKIAQQIHYVNPAVVQKNRKEYPENQWPKEASKRITVYVPEKYQEQIEDIKKIIYYEWFQYTTIDIEDSDFNSIPNEQKTFLFNYHENNDVLAHQEAEGKIIVELDFSLFPSEDEVLNSLYPQVVFDGLFKQEKVLLALKSSGLNQSFSGMTNAAKAIFIKKETLMSQLRGTLIAISVLLIAQFFVIYQYVVTQVRSRGKQIVIRNLLGGNTIFEIFKCLFYLVVGIICISSSLLFYTKNWFIFASLNFLCLTEVSLMISWAFYLIKKKRVQIIKGDFEIL